MLLLPRHKNDFFNGQRAIEMLLLEQLSSSLRYLDYLDQSVKQSLLLDL